VYTLLQRLRSAHPAVEIEACAGGGGRIDAGILRYTHRFWTSDCIDAVSRVSIQRGFLQFFPPEIMGSHIGASPAHSTGRSQSLDFRAAVALPGHLGVELDVRKLNASDRSQLAAWIALYKQLRDTLHTEIWFGDAGDSLLWQAHGTAEQFLLIVYRVEPTHQRHMPSIKLPFVDVASRYQIESIATPGDDTAPLAYNALQFDGSWLANVGLPAPPMKGEAAVIFSIRKC
jgi:alpha-galactosidase